MDKNKDFYFMENEHPDQAEIRMKKAMDFDLVKEQILIAAGTPISGVLYFPEKMHAIECRINAEDP